MRAARTWTAEAVHALGVRTDVATAGEILAGLCRSESYKLHRAGKFPVPVLKVGRRLVVPTQPIMELLQLEMPDPAPAVPLEPAPRILVERDGDRAFVAGQEVPEVIELSRQEYERAIDASLAELGLTYLQLRAQARTGSFSSLRARKLWLAIGER